MLDVVFCAVVEVYEGTHKFVQVGLWFVEINLEDDGIDWFLCIVSVHVE